MLFMTINSLKGYYWTRRRKKQEQIVTDKRKKQNKQKNNDKTKLTATQPRNASTTRFGHVLIYLF